MSRKFTPKQRMRIYRAFGGKCAICGIQVGEFHADHVIAYSRGGETTLRNGQLLCPPCNLSKGDKYVFNTKKYKHIIGNRQWQHRALQGIMAEVNDPVLSIDYQKHHTIIACPGAGKTRLGAAVARALWDQGHIDFIICVSPRQNIRGGWLDTLHTFGGFRLDEMQPQDFSDESVEPQHGMAMTYQTVIRVTEDLDAYCRGRKVAVFLDEVHWSAREREQAFGESLKLAFGAAAQVISLSGTPFRTDRASIPFVRYDSNGKAKPTAGCAYLYSDAIEDHVCRPIVFRRVNANLNYRDKSRNIYLSGRLSDETIAESDGEGGYRPINREANKYLQAAIDPRSGVGFAVIEDAHEKLMAIRKYHADAAGIVIAKDIKEAREYADLMRKILNVRPVVIDSSTRDPQKKIQNFAASDQPWVVSVRMISEGTDIPRLRVLAYVTNVVQPLPFIQATGRVIRMQEDDDISDNQCAYVFMPAYGVLDLMARDIERMVPPGVVAAEERKVCSTCGETPCICPKAPCDVCGQRPCICPRDFDVDVDADDIEKDGSVASGMGFDEDTAETIDRINAEPEAAMINETLKYGFVEIMKNPNHAEIIMRNLNLSAGDIERLQAALGKLMREHTV
jgi:superfamily II DNA or RNA helicase